MKHTFWREIYENFSINFIVWDLVSRTMKFYIKVLAPTLVGELHFKKARIPRSPHLSSSTFRNVQYTGCYIIVRTTRSR